MKLTINFSDFDQVKLGNISNKTILTLVKNDSSSYLIIPSCLTYLPLCNSLDIFSTSLLENDKAIFMTFKNSFINVKSTINSLSKKKLILKGLGFRSIFNETTKKISFKLGYSHSNILDVPEYITNVKIKKNMLLLESTDKVLLGNYIKKIHHLRESDAYKGKGFSYQYDNKKLKVIKKK